jgi:hypothetical protein
MRRSATFWAIVLIAVGSLLLLDNLGLFAGLGVRVWALVGPLLLVALGLWILLGAVAGRPAVEAREVSIPWARTAARQDDGLRAPPGSAGRARIRLHHGAGRLVVGGGAAPDELVAGTFTGGLDWRTRREGDLLRADLSTPASAWRTVVPWAWQGGLNWECRLSDALPLELDLEIGANEARLDLRDLRVTDLRLEAGASSTEVVLPARAGHTRARLEAGAASLTVRVPEGVAARIRAEGALAGIDVDTARFPRAGGAYQSLDYDTAANRVDLKVSAAVGSVSVR